ncbi:hypothetical protein FA15DRAFT_601103 [Coprinopsis marcescibilis]|uniref:Uncharacterized protein n=1 Tax=Coprinopsis marcescibilis TaxID=230819 RepID=A0A5C3KUV9_COPMA|nr:hypothetical protein FA15DRAFT_601103 [Coprinopsis marcescibilis]
MPSHTNSSGLVKFWFAASTFPEAPWRFERWQEITGVDHGLFNTDDKLLPSGWTRNNANAVRQYFQQYGEKASEDLKIKFSAPPRGLPNDPIPGRTFWRDWVTANYSKAWKVHALITSALTSTGLHPVQIAIENQVFDIPPNASSYLPVALDAIGRELFGEEAIDKSGRLSLVLRDPTQILAQRTWQVACRSIKSKRARLTALEGAADSAVSDLTASSDSKITVRAINSAMRSVAAFERAVDAMQTTDGLESLKRLKVDLQQFIPTDPTQPREKGKQTSKKRGSRISNVLATAEEVENLLDVFDEYFSREFESTDELGGDFMRSIISDSDSTACGVGVESSLDDDTLSIRLGFPNGRPFIFNEKRHRGELTPWDEPWEKVLREHPEEFYEFRLHWHQKCGVHAIGRNALSDRSEPDNPTSSLLGDGVGVGKTVQAAAAIAFFSDLCLRQQTDSLNFPQLARELPYLKGHSQFPNRPHLIVVPGTLVSQWVHELRSFFQAKSIDILLYGTGEEAHNSFMKAGGLYESSKHEPCLRIIIATQSAIHQDFLRLYSNERRTRGVLPWEPPERLYVYERTVKFTLYGLEFFTITWDEAQSIRNMGNRHLGALELLRKSHIQLILTATPLQTSFKDICALGRALLMPYFLSEEANRDQMRDETALRRIRKEKDPGVIHSPDEDPTVVYQSAVCEVLRQKFEGRFIRRTPASLGFNNAPLLEIPPLKVIHGVLTLTDREYKYLDSTMDSLNDASTANARKVANSRFYLEHRKGVTFAREPSDPPCPKFNTLEEWEDRKSSKIDCLVRMVQHILTRDDMPPVTFENGVPVFDPAPGSPTFTRDVKILIYQEFPSFIPLVRNVFELYGIQVLCINGRTSYDDRSKIITKFNLDPEPRVLIFSRVGSTGLNLSRANIIIFLDQPWSAQDEEQIRGRAHRQKQKRAVISYHLLGANSADITLAALAAGKKDMLEGFIVSNSGRAINAAINGETLDNDDDDNIPDALFTEQERDNKTKKTKSKVKQSKNKKAKSNAHIVESPSPPSPPSDPAPKLASGNGPLSTTEIDGAPSVAAKDTALKPSESDPSSSNDRPDASNIEREPDAKAHTVTDNSFFRAASRAGSESEFSSSYNPIESSICGACLSDLSQLVTILEHSLDTDRESDRSSIYPDSLNPLNLPPSGTYDESQLLSF